MLCVHRLDIADAAKTEIETWEPWACSAMMLVLYKVLSRVRIAFRGVGGQAGKRAWADAANECHCSLYP